MPVAEIPPKWETSDGREFASAKAAEKHEKLLLARTAYNDAQRRLGVLLAESQGTADGYPFDLSAMRDYYWISHYWEFPVLRKVSFYLWNLAFENLGEGVEVSIVDYKGSADDRKPVYYRVSTLYRRQEAAEAALVVAQEEWLREKAAEVAETRRKVFPGER